MASVNWDQRLGAVASADTSWRTRFPERIFSRSGKGLNFNVRSEPALGATMHHNSINGESLKFPDGFLWGTATSTTQIEGHINNEWTDFIARDGGTCRIACDSYHRYPEDIEWMRQLGVNAYRMGIEWSRLQTEAYGPLNQAALARYADQIDRLNGSGITPMVVQQQIDVWNQ